MVTAQNEEILKAALPEHRSAHFLMQPRPSPPVLTGAVLNVLPVGSAAIQRKLAILVVEGMFRLTSCALR